MLQALREELASMEEDTEAASRGHTKTHWLGNVPRRMDETDETDWKLGTGKLGGNREGRVLGGIFEEELQILVKRTVRDLMSTKLDVIENIINDCGRKVYSLEGELKTLKGERLRSFETGLKSIQTKMQVRDEATITLEQRLDTLEVAVEKIKNDAVVSSRSRSNDARNVESSDARSGSLTLPGVSPRARSPRVVRLDRSPATIVPEDRSELGGGFLSPSSNSRLRRLDTPETVRVAPVAASGGSCRVAGSSESRAVQVAVSGGSSKMLTGASGSSQVVRSASAPNLQAPALPTRTGTSASAIPGSFTARVGTTAMPGSFTSGGAVGLHGSFTSPGMQGPFTSGTRVATNGSFTGPANVQPLSRGMSVGALQQFNAMPMGNTIFQRSAGVPQSVAYPHASVKGFSPATRKYV